MNIPPPPPDINRVQQALALSELNPEHALQILAEVAEQFRQRKEFRHAAFALHQRAAIALRLNQSPLSDLALAARLLREHPNARAVVLFDLAQALLQANDIQRAILICRECETVAHQIGERKVALAARELLNQFANEAPSPAIEKKASQREQAVEDELAELKRKMGII